MVLVEECGAALLELLEKAAIESRIGCSPPSTSPQSAPTVPYCLLRSQACTSPHFSPHQLSHLLFPILALSRLFALDPSSVAALYLLFVALSCVLPLLSPVTSLPPPVCGFDCRSLSFWCIVSWDQR